MLADIIEKDIWETRRVSVQNTTMKVVPACGRELLMGCCMTCGECYEPKIRKCPKCKQQALSLMKEV